MRSAVGPRVLIGALIVALLGLATLPLSVVADQNFGGLTPALRAGPPAIDDFRYDKLVLEGRAGDVCAGRQGTGTTRTYYEITGRFGGSPGTLYACRERWDALNNPDCNGTLVNPVTNPNFMSTCWSNHAAGRALDVLVGNFGSGYNTARGVAIVNWLLATDTSGNVNANARKLGVQQILFNNRCWNSDGDRGITSYWSMRSCGIGHENHVHIDMTEAGARGDVSYWGVVAPEVAPKMDTQVYWDQDSSWRNVVSWRNLRATAESSGPLPSGFDQAVAGDWSGDGVEDEIFLWDSDTGAWFLQSWQEGESVNARAAQWSSAFDVIIAGDWDADGTVDDMLIWDRDSGRYSIQAWWDFTFHFQGTGYISPGFERIVAADLDGDGFLNDMLLWDNDTGKWIAFSWNNFQLRWRNGGYWSRYYDDILVGDWNAGGDLDEMLLWDRDTGRWVLLSWADYRWTYVRDGFWSTIYDFATPGDYDTDGRIDDIFLYDVATGVWSIYSYHRNEAFFRLSQDWGAGFDTITVGAFAD